MAKFPTSTIEYKKCNHCKEVKPLNDFYTRKNRGEHSRQNNCKVCSNKQTVKRLIENKIKNVEYLGGKCQSCGYNTYNGSLIFHHKNPEEKSYDINKIRSQSFNKRKKELDKCLLLCRNCHQELHFNEKETKEITSRARSLRKTKQKMIKYKGGSCIYCGYNKCESALDFHHVNSEDKDFSLSRVICMIAKIKELDKCVLVCANCHGELHAYLKDTPPNEQEQKRINEGTIIGDKNIFKKYSK